MDSQNIPNGYQVLKEGKAKILYKEEKLEIDDNNMIHTKKGKRIANPVNVDRGAVFYNPVQEFNRDFSILAIREFSKIKEEELKKKNREFKGIDILEALSATGLRSVRYLKEIDNINLLVANDIDPAATQLMQQNFDFNKIKQEKYQIYTEDAIDLMNTMRKDKKYFDVIDLDPYGTAVPFLESSISALADGGMMAVTFTDMAVLCARNPHVCFYKYGGIPIPKKYCHEMALRIVLHMISTMANKYHRYVEPLISLTVDFYIRLFFRVKESAINCHQSIKKYSNVYQCLDCEAFYLQSLGYHVEQEITLNNQGHKIKKTTKKSTEENKQITTDDKEEDKQQQDIEQEQQIQEQDEDQNETKISKNKFVISRALPNTCKVCDGPLIMGGPIWNQKINNVDFAKQLLESCRSQDIIEGTNSINKDPEAQQRLQTSARIQAVLTAIIDEDILGGYPLSYNFSQISSALRATNPKKGEIMAAFKSLNHSLTQTFYDPTLYKTNAPPEDIYDIFKQWKLKCCNNDQKEFLKNVSEQSPAYRILQKPPKIEPNFDMESVKQKLAFEKQKIKYMPNPQPNWGPKSRATGNKQNKKEKE